MTDQGAAASAKEEPTKLLTLDRQALLAMAAAKATEFRSAEPFPSIVIDDFLPEAVVRRLVDEFPRASDVEWQKYDTNKELKLALEDETLIPTPLVEVLRELNAQVFVEFLEVLTGIDGLIPDPHFRGAGLHQILPGGMLKVHADFDLHPRLRVHRRLNAILYLNEDWDDSYGGSLELWDRSMTAAVRAIAPIANRLVIFSTTDESNHGHPDQLTCPPGRSRQSMAWYYYTALEASTATPAHSTLFRERPGETFVSRRERVMARASAALPPSAKESVKRLLGRG